VKTHAARPVAVRQVAPCRFANVGDTLARERRRKLPGRRAYAVVAVASEKEKEVDADAVRIPAAR
jgi:hypothetical protein